MSVDSFTVVMYCLLGARPRKKPKDEEDPGKVLDKTQFRGFDIKFYKNRNLINSILMNITNLFSILLISRRIRDSIRVWGGGGE